MPIAKLVGGPLDGQKIPIPVIYDTITLSSHLSSTEDQAEFYEISEYQQGKYVPESEEDETEVIFRHHGSCHCAPFMRK